MRSIAIAGLLAFVGACGTSAFICADDAACAGPEGGRCESGGSCSFPDPECASGRRYGERSVPELAGTCVALDDGTSTSTTTTTFTTTTTTTTTSTSTSTSTDATTDAMPDVGGVPVTTGDVCPPDWWDCEYRQRISLTLEAQDGEHADVTIPLRLVGDRIDYNATQPGGADVRVVDEAGVSLAYEIERWDPSATSVLWLRVPVLGSTPPPLWLYYDNPDATAVGDPNVVWSELHAAVWHMDGGVIDATGNNEDGVSSGTVVDADGRLGGALEFAVDGDRVDVAPADATADLFLTGGTISAWVNADTFGGTLRGRIADNSEAAAAGWMFYLSGDSGGELAWRLGYPFEQTIWGTPSGTIDLRTWHYVVAVFDASIDTAPHLYIDGVAHEVELSSGDSIGDPPSDAGHVVTIGNSDVPSRWFDGRIDELRLERIARDAQWIALQHRAMTDGVVTYGAIESLP